MNAKGQSDDLKALIQHQAQIKKWLLEVNKRISDLEESYLEDTPLGNIVRGWEIDGRPLPLRNRGQEKLFSNSSYQVWFENKSQQDADQVDRKVGNKTEGSSQRGAGNKTTKKARKSGNLKKESLISADPDWGQAGDY